MKRFGFMFKKSAWLSLFFIIGGSAMAIEEPSYELVKKYEKFEVRKYAPYLVAQVKVTGDFSEVGNSGFRILADYIFGNNEKKSKLEMTAPVLLKSSEKIPMTAPVMLTSSSGEYLIEFVLPKEYTLQTVPTPKDTRVKLIQVPERWVGVRRYSGTWSEEHYLEQRGILQSELKVAGLQEVGPASFARYNPPFIPWFLRRNEVLIPIALSDRSSSEKR